MKRHQGYCEISITWKLWLTQPLRDVRADPDLPHKSSNMPSQHPRLLDLHGVSRCPLNEWQLLPEHLLVKYLVRSSSYLSSYLSWIPGIGRATAIALSKAGWSLVLFARRLELLCETKELCDNPALCVYFAGDVSNEQSVADLFKFAVQSFGMSKLSMSLIELYLCVVLFPHQTLINAWLIPDIHVGRVDMLFNVRPFPYYLIIPWPSVSIHTSECGSERSCDSNRWTFPFNLSTCCGCQLDWCLLMYKGGVQGFQIPVASRRYV